MNPVLQERLKHVLWIGGATDSGKSTVAQILAKRLGFSVYHYDKADAEHLEKIADTVPEVHQFLAASLEERWLDPTPQQMFDYLLLVFPHRFQFVVDSLLAMPKGAPVIVEGFGLLPELIHPVLSDRHQAIWFVPTEKFKWESMTRRGKPSFASSLTNPEKAKTNLFFRDMLLADYLRKQVASYGYSLSELDGSKSADEMADMTEMHFSKYVHEIDSKLRFANGG